MAIAADTSCDDSDTAVTALAMVELINEFDDIPREVLDAERIMRIIHRVRFFEINCSFANIHPGTSFSYFSYCVELAEECKNVSRRINGSSEFTLFGTHDDNMTCGNIRVLSARGKTFRTRAKTTFVLLATLPTFPCFASGNRSSSR